jgi:hypothetical protein
MGKEDLERCVHISFPMQSGYCGSVHLTKIIKRRRFSGHRPMLGVNHVYPMLWLLCALWFLCELCLL